MLQNEIMVYLGLDHPNICRLQEVYYKGEEVFLVMELCEGRELYERLAQKKSFNEQVASGCIHSMLRAINYLHQNSVCHRDLKLENWVFGDVGFDPKTLKLIDFGFAQIYKEGVPMTSVHGTVYYVAPEVLVNQS